VADKHGERGGTEQHVDQHVVELREEAEDLASLRRRGEPIRAVVLFARFGLLRGEAIRARLERCEDVARGLSMPVTLGLADLARRYGLFRRASKVRQD
jgi:hypothetical protein